MSHGIYLSFPIDQALMVLPMVRDVQDWLRDDPRVSWIYNPGSAFDVGKGERNSGIRDINLAALDRSSIVVAFVPRETATIGALIGIERAVSAGKQVIILSDAPSWMLQYGDESVRSYTGWSPAAAVGLAEALETPTGGPPWGLGAPRSARGSRLPVVVSKGAEAPRRGYDDDAGLDLVVSQTIEIPPGEFVDVPCGVSAQLPDWSWGLIIGRSSTLRKRGLLVSPGVIDAGWRGELFAGVQNLSGTETVVVKRGERIAQLIVMMNGTRLVEIERVDELAPGSRGDHGFGSTGGTGE